MADRPILFSGPMVRALLDGRKTQTRRILNPQQQADMGLIGIYAPGLTAVFGYETPDADCKVPLRYMPGDRLYVREAWRTGAAFDPVAPRDLPTTVHVAYEADANRARLTGKFRQGMHMPRWASRLTLIVTDVRVQRLQDISDRGASNDCTAEGVYHSDMSVPTYEEWHGAGFRSAERYMFRTLWDSLNADRGYGWDVNPFVVALTFTVHQQNIDAMEAE